MGHVSRLLLVVQHTFAHFVNDQLAALDVIFRSLHLTLQLLDLGTLFVLKRLKFVLFLEEGVAVGSHFVQFLVGTLDFVIALLDSLGFLFLGQLDFSLDLSLGFPRLFFDLL